MGTLLKRALDQAAIWHQPQKRKYPGISVPYVSHLAGVTAILARHGFDEEVQAAGALHDAIEDTPASYQDIEQAFGARVAQLVQCVSEEDKSLSWEVRKQRYLDRFPHEPWEAQAITLADKIDNLLSIVVCQQLYGDPWAQFKRGRDQQLDRYEKLRALVLALEPHALIDEYIAVLDQVTALPH